MSPRPPPTAQPRKSNPGPRLATVAGAKADRDRYKGEGSVTPEGEAVVRPRGLAWDEHRTVGKRGRRKGWLRSAVREGYGEVAGKVAAAIIVIASG